MNTVWFLAWLVAVEAVSFAALPFALRFFAPLSDRGYLLSKPLGILVVGYVCWLPGIFGLVSYQRTTIIVVVVLLAAAAWVLWGREAIEACSAARIRFIAMEALFLIALVAASVVRALSPDISGTEKPMDFAFLNSIVRTDTLPPEDPWMAGFGISYYYFGYYLIGTLTKLAAIPSSVGYNLGVALVFALIVAGSFSLAYNLVSALTPRWHGAARFAAALLAPIIVAVMGNLEIVAEILAARGYSNPAFWHWMGIKNLQPAAVPDGWFPTGFWWWWRASRVIPTTTPDGINEFPFFSFLLGDLHPHFTGAPWFLLAASLSLSVLMWRGKTSLDVGGWPRDLAAALVLGFTLVGNSWDFPAAAGLYWLACSVPLAGETWDGATLRSGLARAAVTTALSVGLYVPFFFGFASQTRGIGISADRTPLASLLIIFGAMIVGLLLVLFWRGWGSEHGSQPRRTRRAIVLVGLSMCAASALWGALLLLLGMGLLCVAAALRYFGSNPDPSPRREAGLFLLTLIGAGLFLITVPEFLFVNDLFGTRMNTVFKFHYEAWQLLGVAVTVGIAWLLASAPRFVFKAGAILLFALPVAAGLLYPGAAIASRAHDSPSQPTLDGAAFYRSLHPDDFAAIQWLSRDAVGRPVVLEATGGSYSDYARVATFSGLPTVLGWGPHESQWGRSSGELRRRTQDIDAIYSTAQPEMVISLLRQYRVRYVYIGSLEIEKYGVGTLSRFQGLLEPAYRQGSVAIFRVPG